MNLRDIGWEGMGSSGLGQGLVAGSYENSN
jgi:hypothetical protein